MTKRTWWTLGAVLCLTTGLACGSSSSPTDEGTDTADVAADIRPEPVGEVGERAHRRVLRSQHGRQVRGGCGGGRHGPSILSSPAP